MVTCRLARRSSLSRLPEYFDDHVLWGGLTYGAHALSCAAGIATINVYKEDRLIERVPRWASSWVRKWKNSKPNHPSVGDVRYIGLFAILELVHNRKTREPMAPFNARADQMGPMAQVAKFFRENGLYTFVRWNTFFVNPPLCITRDELMEGLEIVDRALEITDDSVVE